MSAYRMPDNGERCAQCGEPFDKHRCRTALGDPEGRWHTGWCCSVGCADRRAAAMKHCTVHDLPTNGDLAKIVIDAKGRGASVCAACIDRAIDEAKRNLARSEADFFAALGAIGAKR